MISFPIVVIRHVDCAMAPPAGWSGSERGILVIKCDKSMMSIPFPLHISRVALRAQYCWNGLLCLFTCLCRQSSAKQVLRIPKLSICGYSAIRDSLTDSLSNTNTHTSTWPLRKWGEEVTNLAFLIKTQTWLASSCWHWGRDIWQDKTLDGAYQRK